MFQEVYLVLDVYTGQPCLATHFFFQASRQGSQSWLDLPARLAFSPKDSQNSNLIHIEHLFKVVPVDLQHIFRRHIIQWSRLQVWLWLIVCKETLFDKAREWLVAELVHRWPILHCVDELFFTIELLLELRALQGVFQESCRIGSLVPKRAIPDQSDSWVQE